MSSGGRQSHKFETRISAIADFACECKRKKKALPLSPLTPGRAGATRYNWACGGGGFGDQRTRDPQRLAEDALDGLITADEARRERPTRRGGWIWRRPNAFVGWVGQPRSGVTHHLDASPSDR